MKNYTIVGRPTWYMQWEEDIYQRLKQMHHKQEDINNKNEVNININVNIEKKKQFELSEFE